MRTLIVDDELPARKLLIEYLKKDKDIIIVGEASNGFEALKAIQKEKPDLIFLDIQMPKINGFELLELIDDCPEVIFVTAYSEYAIQAFKANAIDYLLKPIHEESLKDAVKKAKLKIQSVSKNSYDKLNEIRLEENQELDRVVVKTGSQIHIIPVEDILQIMAEDDYIRIITSDSRFLKKQTMKFMESHLPPNDFVRVHRSHILNVSKIEKIEALSKESYVAILKNKEKVPVSNAGYQQLKLILKFS